MVFARSRSPGPVCLVPLICWSDSGQDTALCYKTALLGHTKNYLYPPRHIDLGRVNGYFAVF
jgi:hypothetical protein